MLFRPSMLIVIKMLIKVHIKLDRSVYKQGQHIKSEVEVTLETGKVTHSSLTLANWGSGEGGGPDGAAGAGDGVRVQPGGGGRVQEEGDPGCL